MSRQFVHECFETIKTYATLNDIGREEMQANFDVAVKNLEALLAGELLPSPPVLGEGRIWDGSKWLTTAPSCETFAMLNIIRICKYAGPIFEQLLRSTRRGLEGGCGNAQLIRQSEESIKLLKSIGGEQS